ncbi:Acetolactate synthase, small subunit [Clostridium bornimense]|uniref:Acetolactate synthase small subunit n=1 Tax=Clostridium bornimense TaxID=1216932 RepID=W6S2R8_9CLOT|nr:acetolactate synthase small subunit [Clostridium bornimense]CDM68602.1 Acetolactate synthase, small subunit [Clostridium bornimense]
MKKYVLLAIVEDNPGVLTRVCQLFTRRSFNLDSVTAGKTEKEGFSRLTLITTAENDYVVDQICKQMSKLEEVKKVKALEEDMIICKEIAMIKIKCDNNKKTEIVNIANIFKGTIVDVSKETVTVEMTADVEKLNAFIELVKEDIVELVSSGYIAMERGSLVL